MRRSILLHIISALVLGLLAGPAVAGVVFEVETTDHTQGEPRSEVIEIRAEGKNLTMEIPAQGEGSPDAMIYRGVQREMVVLEHQKKTYMLIDEEAVRALAGEVSSALSQIEEAMANIPEKQRAMMEQLLKERMPSPTTEQEKPTVELRKTGKKAEKQGYPCVEYEVWREGQKLRELWVTDWGNVEGGKDVAAAFEGMADFFSELIESIPSVGGGLGGGFGGLADNPMASMREIGGFPVVIRELGEDGSLEGESALRSARRQTIDPDAFEPPSGYKRQEMFSPATP